MKIKYTKLIPLAIAGIVSSFGLNVFLAPMAIYDSGVTGLSFLLENLTRIPLEIFLLVINIPLFIFSFKSIGKDFTFYSIFSLVIYVLNSFIISYVIFPGGDVVSPLAGTDYFLAAVFGGGLCGLGSGLAIRYGGALDGMEVVAQNVCKRLPISTTAFSMVFNLLLYISAGFLTKTWYTPLYSIVAFYIGSRVINFVIDGFDNQKACSIITTKPDVMAKAISEAFKTGITLNDVKGCYSGENKTNVYVVVNRFNLNKLKSLVRRVDPNAYMSVTEIIDVYHPSKEEK